MTKGTTQTLIKLKEFLENDCKDLQLKQNDVYLAIYEGYSALKDEINRIEGCWLCEELLQEMFDFHEQKHSLQMVHGKLRIRLGNKEITSFKTKFCPNCGKKIKEVFYG